MIIAIFSITNIPAVKEFLAEEPWTYSFAWPGLDVHNAAGEPVSTTTFKFNWLPAAGTLMIFAGMITAADPQGLARPRPPGPTSGPTSS